LGCWGQPILKRFDTKAQFVQLPRLVLINEQAAYFAKFTRERAKRRGVEASCAKFCE
jgi:hypothetical protein